MTRILIIDDEPQVRELICDLLNTHFPEAIIDQADTGEEGLEIVDRHIPDLIFVDLKLPEMDGLEICSQLRSREATRHTPIVIASGFLEDSESRAKGLNAGADAFLRKPFDGAEMAALVRALLRLKKAELQLLDENIMLEKLVQERTAELESSRADYQDLFDHAPDPFLEIDAATRKIVRVNQTATRLLGGAEALQGSSVESILHTDSRAAVARMLDELWTTGRSQVLQVKALTTENDILHASLNTTVGCDDSNRIICYRMILRDITESIKTETRIDQQRRQAQQVLDTASVMLTLLNKNGEIELINRKGCEILGYEEQNLLGKDWFKIAIPARQRKEIKGVFEQIMANDIEPVKFYENRVVNRSGEEHLIAFHNTLVFDEHKQITGVLSSGEDITEKHKAEKAILESEERFRALFHYSPDALYLNDLKGNFIDGNRAAEKITGYKKEELVGKSFLTLNLLPSNQIVKASKLLAKNLTGRKTGPDDFTLRRKDGTLVELEIQTFPIKLQNRATVLGSARDVTKRKKTERKMEQALQEAENSNRVKNLFLENMSHEIRTPLNSILGFAEILNDRLGRHLDKDEHFMFTSIKASGERLLRTVHEVLDIAQFEAGTMITTPEKLTLSDLVRNVVAEYREIATEKGLELTYTDTAGELQLMLDGDTIYKAISHLVHNAVKYSDEGSVRLQLYAEAGEYRLSIGDTGIGMSAEYIENIYDAFSQESTGYTKKYQGLGLGLALTKRYLDANKVNLSFESKKDQGTTFLLTFSSALEVKGETGTTPVPDEQVGETPVDERFKYTILVVEDDIPSQLLLKHLLADNHQLHYAKSVVEARRCLKENKIDLVILDLSLLGNEDGLDLVHHMQKNKSHRDIPVIAVTAHAFTQDRKNVLEAGCVEFITKPVTGDDVKNVIERILRSGE